MLLHKQLYIDYYKFYNDLIHDERLLAVMRKYGYKGILGMHPIHSEQTVDFEKVEEEA